MKKIISILVCSALCFSFTYTPVLASNTSINNLSDSEAMIYSDIDYSSLIKQDMPEETADKASIGNYSIGKNSTKLFDGNVSLDDAEELNNVSSSVLPLKRSLGSSQAYTNSAPLADLALRFLMKKV